MLVMRRSSSASCTLRMAVAHTSAAAWAMERSSILKKCEEGCETISAPRVSPKETSGTHSSEPAPGKQAGQFWRAATSLATAFMRVEKAWPIMPTRSDSAKLSGRF